MLISFLLHKILYQPSGAIFLKNRFRAIYLSYGNFISLWFRLSTYYFLQGHESAVGDVDNLKLCSHFLGLHYLFALHPCYVEYIITSKCTITIPLY